MVSGGKERRTSKEKLGPVSFLEGLKSHTNHLSNLPEIPRAAKG